MTDYRHAFPDFDYELPSLPNFADVSGKNDTCPSLFSRVLGLKIFCDYADVGRREDARSLRYALHLSDAWGAAVDEEGMETGGSPDYALLVSDDWEAIVNKVNELRSVPAMARRIEIAALAEPAGFKIHDSSNGDSAWVLFDDRNQQIVSFESAIWHSALPTPDEEKEGWYIGPLHDVDRNDPAVIKVDTIEQAIETALRMRDQQPAAPGV